MTISWRRRRKCCAGSCDAWERREMRMGEKIGKIGKTLEKSGVSVVTCISLLLGLGLTYYSAFYTEESLGETGISHTVRDSAILNVLVVLIVAALFDVLRKALERKRRTSPNFSARLEKVLLIAALIYSVAAGGIWVAVAHVAPDADAKSVCVVAEYVLAGEFPMQPPTYMGYFPHQFGIVFVLHKLFALFGSGNYAAWQYMNVLFFPLLIFAGYRTVKLIFEKSETGIFYLLLVLGYLPLYFYLPYVYGDFASAACGMVVIWQTVSFCKNEKYSAVGWGTLAAVFGCLVRKNTLIVVIAAVLVLLVRSLCRARFRLLLMAFVMPLAIWGADRGVELYYEHLSGQQISEGIPTVCWIMMGLEDEEEGPGWFNGFNYQAYTDHNFDYGATEQYSRELIQARLQELWHNKPYAVDFFRRKILTQWNMPDCYSLHETRHFDCETDELSEAVREVYYGGTGDRLQAFMNRYQFVIYVGFALAAAGLLRRDKRGIENCLPLIAIVGGFLFSILWEAMSRYVLSYVVYMIPMAAAGIEQLPDWIESGRKILKKRKQMPEKIRQIPEKIRKAGGVLERAADKILLAISIVISWGLTFCSMTLTEELQTGTEIPVTTSDNAGINLLILFAVAAVFFLLRRILLKKCRLKFDKVRVAIVAAAAIYVTVVCVVWVSICHVKPRADGGSLCYVARLVMQGRFGTMVPPGYMSYNPHQFSLLAVIQILFALFGIGKYKAFQYMNALCMPLLFYSGYKLLRLICKRSEPVFYYILLFVSCLPLFLYVPYVYGEITSTTFTMVLMWQVVRYCKTGKKTCFLWGTLAITFACIMRMNSLIVLAAAGIVLVLYALRAAKPQAVAWLLAMIVAVFATDGCIRAYYEHISGKEVLDGIPYISYVLMGLRDGERGPGWYDQSNYTELMLHDYDTELTAIDNQEQVKERLKEFWDDKAYGIDFFGRKIASQWNSPAYHSIFETRIFNCKKEELPEVVRRFYYDEEAAVRVFMNRYQFVLYFFTAFMTIVSLFAKRKERDLEDRILLIAIVGGFLFSIGWEAMSRYVLPYVVYMIPLAAIGIWQLQELLGAGAERLRGKLRDRRRL